MAATADKNKKTLAEIFAHTRVEIAIEKDNFAYLSCVGANYDKLFDLLKKSFTREVSKYNNFFHRYENTRVKHFSLVEKGAKLKVKAGLVPFLCNSLYVNKINYNITNKRCGVHVTDPDDFAFQLNMFVELRPYQKEAVEAVFNSSAGNFCCVQLPTGSGKQQPVSSHVLTPNGWVTIGSIKVGDFVIDGEGNATKVIGVYPQGVKDVYGLTFSDDSYAECGLEHLWTVSSDKYRKEAPHFETLTLSKILERYRLGFDYYGRNGQWKYEIPITSVKGENKELFIHPYVLGVLIADGYLCSKNGDVVFSCSDMDIQVKEQVESLLDDKYTLSTHVIPTCNQYNIIRKHSGPGCWANEYKNFIWSMGLNVKSLQKFIPDEYLYGTSYEQRKQLLQGLMDCDGTQDKTKAKTSYSTMSERLAKDVVKLVQSLGGTATISSQDREGMNTEYRIAVKVDFCPFTLERKAQRWFDHPSSDKIRRYIRRVELLRKEESVCIEVESACKQYLTDDFIVTHNTEVSASVIKTYMNVAKSKSNYVVYVVPTVKLQKEATARFTSYGIQCNIGGVDFQPDCVNITTYMALVRSAIAKETAAKVGCIIWDEAHHLKAEKSSKAVHQFKNLQMSVGLSATITPDIEYKRTLKRINNDDFNIFGVTGMPVYYKTIVETIKEEFVTPVEIRVVENDECVHVKSKEEIPTWHEIKKQVLMSPNRTALICDTVRHIVETQGFNTICLLIPEVEWSRLVMRDIYNEFCNDENTAIILTYGNNTYDVYVDGKLVRANDAEDKAELDRLIKDPDVRTIFSCTSYAYEGIDITNMQAIINVYGGKSTTRVKQQAGRVMRLFGDKNKAYIYEFADKNCQVAMNQFNARRKIYKNDYHAKIVVEKFNK